MERLSLETQSRKDGSQNLWPTSLYRVRVRSLPKRSPTEMRRRDGIHAYLDVELNQSCRHTSSESRTYRASLSSYDSNQPTPFDDNNPSQASRSCECILGSLYASASQPIFQRP